MTSTEKLVQALIDSYAPLELIKKAENNNFNDFKSDSATPIIDLVMECEKLGLKSVADRARNGEFDATKEEAQAYWIAEGQYLIKEKI